MELNLIIYYSHCGEKKHILYHGAVYSILNPFPRDMSPASGCSPTLWKLSSKLSMHKACTRTPNTLSLDSFLKIFRVRKSGHIPAIFFQIYVDLPHWNGACPSTEIFGWSFSFPCSIYGVCTVHISISGNQCLPSMYGHLHNTFLWISATSWRPYCENHQICKYFASWVSIDAKGAFSKVSIQYYLILFS